VSNLNRTTGQDGCRSTVQVNCRFIVYGKVTESGTGLCIKGAKWGEFALLPRKYEYLL